MNRLSVLSAVVLIMFTAGICQADSLVITYRSGKTQTVILDEPSLSVNSWQFVGGAAPTTQLQKGEAPPTPVDDKLTGTAPEKKPNVRIKWNAKPIVD